MPPAQRAAFNLEWREKQNVWLAKNHEEMLKLQRKQNLRMEGFNAIPTEVVLETMRFMDTQTICNFIQSSKADYNIWTLNKAYILRSMQDTQFSEFTTVFGYPDLRSEDQHQTYTYVVDDMFASFSLPSLPSITDLFSLPLWHRQFEVQRTVRAIQDAEVAIFATFELTADLALCRALIMLLWRMTFDPANPSTYSPIDTAARQVRIFRSQPLNIQRFFLQTIITLTIRLEKGLSLSECAARWALQNEIVPEDPDDLEEFIRRLGDAVSITAFQTLLELGISGSVPFMEEIVEGSEFMDTWVERVTGFEAVLEDAVAGRVSEADTMLVAEMGLDVEMSRERVKGWLDMFRCEKG